MTMVYLLFWSHHSELGQDPSYWPPVADLGISQTKSQKMER